MESPWVIGKSYFIRTVTMHVIGTLRWEGPTELVLNPTVWVADSGRFHTALQTGTLSEVEPFINPVIVGRAAIVDATEWSHEVPTAQI